MKYQVIVLDLDGTLTNSKKEITPPTRDALIEIQQNGKKVVLASGRPLNGVAPLTVRESPAVLTMQLFIIRLSHRKSSVRFTRR